jgi:hypothetical protein
MDLVGQLLVTQASISNQRHEQRTVDVIHAVSFLVLCLVKEG